MKRVQVNDEHLIAWEKGIRADERSIVTKELKRVAALLQDCTTTLYKLIITPDSDPRKMDYHAPKPRKRTTATPHEMDVILEMLTVWSIEGKTGLKPSEIREHCDVGRGTIAAACRELVADGKVTVHKGKYRIVAAEPQEPTNGYSTDRQ